MPKRIAGLSVVVLRGDLYTIGGFDENDTVQSAIHRLSCSSGNCAWTTINQELKVGRGFPIVVPVSNDLCVPVQP